MASQGENDTKRRALVEHGVLNPHPERVRDEAFQLNEFFDARDLAQVKYEMLRRVLRKGESVTETAERFGLSRPTFYQARRALEREGLGGLLPKRRGPKGPHKLTEEVIAAVERRQAEESGMSSRALAEFVAERFGVGVHPRSIERALERRKKKRQQGR